MADFWELVVYWSERELRPSNRASGPRRGLLGGGSRPPPMPPHIFEVEMQGKKFASAHVDLARVVKLYQDAMQTGFARRRRMVFKSQGWSASDVSLLCEDDP